MVLSSVLYVVFVQMCVVFCGNERVEVVCVIVYDGDRCFRRGIVVRVVDVDEDGADVAVRYIYGVALLMVHWDCLDWMN